MFSHPILFMQEYRDPMLSASIPSPTPAPSSPPVDDLSRVFNTALVSSRIDPSHDHATELFKIVETGAFRAILGAVRQLARSEGLSDRDAATDIIQTFRKLDGVWTDYLVREGADRLKATTA